MRLVISLMALSALSDLVSGVGKGTNSGSPTISTRALGPTSALRLTAEAYGILGAVLA